MASNYGSRFRAGVPVCLAFGIGVLLTQALDKSAPHAANHRGARSIGSDAAQGSQSRDENRGLLHERALRDHESEPKEDGWSEATSRILRSDLEQITAEGQFRVVDVDCRSITCAAILEWSTYDVAVKTWAAILNYPFQANCGVEVFLAQPDRNIAQYRSVALFRCHAENEHG